MMVIGFDCLYRKGFTKITLISHCPPGMGLNVRLDGYTLRFRLAYWGDYDFVRSFMR